MVSCEADVGVVISMETVVVIDYEAKARLEEIFEKVALARVLEAGRRVKFCMCM